MNLRNLASVTVLLLQEQERGGRRQQSESVLLHRRDERQPAAGEHVRRDPEKGDHVLGCSQDRGYVNDAHVQIVGYSTGGHHVVHTLPFVDIKTKVPSLKRNLQFDVKKS